jgi:gas vesicle protein
MEEKLDLIAETLGEILAEIKDWREETGQEMARLRFHVDEIPRVAKAIESLEKTIRAQRDGI